MDVINNRVWIENTSPRVTDISKLDLETYYTINVLKQAGAEFEIGPANPPMYGVGIYCTNFSLAEIKQILIKNRHTLSRPLEEATKTYEDEEDIVDNLKEHLKNLSVRYNLAILNGSFGPKDNDIKEEVISTFNKDIIPLIDSLTVKDQARLLKDLKDDLNIESGEIIQETIKRLNHNLGFNELEIEEERVEHDIPTLIASKIVALLKNYHLAKKEGIYGANNDIVLNSLANEFNSVIVPSITSLSREEKIILAEKLNDIPDSLDIDRGILNRLIEEINSLLGRQK